MRPTLRVTAVAAAASAVVAAMGALLAWRTPHGAPWVAAQLGGVWLLFAAGVLLVRRLPVRVATPLILAGGVALPLVVAFAPPRSSDDLYRYVWDGRVQAAGTNPYQYAPAAPQLAGLRDETLWPHDAPWCLPAQSPAPGCTVINRPTARTAYPPVAQVVFLGVHLLSPPGLTHAGAPVHVPVQLAMTAFAVATTMLLVLGLGAVGGDPRLAALWAWCPAVAWEVGSNAHVDVVAAFLTGLALLVLARARSAGRAAWGGALLGLAIATKLTPALVMPAVLRRRPTAVAGASLAAVTVVYLPHVVAVGAKAIGYVPGYLGEEGYRSGARFALLVWLAPNRAAVLLAVALLVGVAFLVLRTADPDRPWHAAATMVGAALFVAAPSYPWYGLLLVLLVALGAPAEWLAVVAAGYLAQFSAQLNLDEDVARPIGYAIALALVLVGAYARRSRARRTATIALPGRPSATGAPRLRVPRR